MQMKRIVTLVFSLILCWSIHAGDVIDIPVGRIFEIDKHGNIYTNFKLHTISKYSPNGKMLLKMGQKGEGPGDIKRLGWFAINPLDQTVYVTECCGGNKWVSKFSSNGKYLGNWKLQLDRTVFKDLMTIDFDHKGNVYLQAIIPRYRQQKDFLLIGEEIHLLKFSPGGKLLKSIYRFNRDFAVEKSGKGNVTIPFHDELKWIVHNEKVVVAESHSNKIKVFDADCNLEKTITLPFKSKKVVDKDLEQWEFRMKSIRWVKRGIAAGWFDLKYWRKKLPFPKYKPVYGSSFFLDSQGNLIVQKNIDASSKVKVWAKVNLTSNKITLEKRFNKGYLKYIWKDYYYVQNFSVEIDDWVLLKIHRKHFW